MATEKIPAETRTEFGKGAARRIRRDNKIPAVVYGHGNDPVHVTLPGHDTMMAIKHGGANALLELEIEGKGQLALTKEVQIDPIRRIIEHIDFVAVRRGEKVTVDVPVHLARRGRLGDAGRHRELHGPDRGRGDPHPRAHRGLDRGRRAGTQIQAGRARRCPRAPRCWSTPRRSSSTSPRAVRGGRSRPSSRRPRPRPASSARSPSPPTSEQAAEGGESAGEDSAAEGDSSEE